jgi:MYXO-CTERM domain-containing protein
MKRYPKPQDRYLKLHEREVGTMHPKALVSTLCTLCTLSILLLAGPAHARGEGVRWYRGLQGPAQAGSAEEVARAYVAQRAARLGLERVELGEQARVLPWRDHRVVRIPQTFEGLPVFNRVVIVRVDPRGRVQTVTTNARADIDVVTRPAVPAAKALRTAARIWGVSDLSAARATLGIQPRGRHGTLIWRVDGAVGLRGTRTLVDAISGEVLHRFWRVWNAEASVYGQNPVATPSLSTVELVDLPVDATALNGDYITTYRYVDGSMNQQNPQVSDFTLEQTALADGNGDFHYTPTTDASQPDFHDPYAEVSVYYHASRVYRYFREVHGYSSTKNHVALANYGEGSESTYDNAFFSPVGANDYLMAMGQGNNVDLGYDGDVIYHEFGHSVIDNIAQMTSQFEMMDEWGINTGPGGIHEGLADYWAATITEDAVMGEYSLEGIQAGAGRDLTIPKSCPADIWGEVHDDGEVFGSATWASRQAVGDAALHDDIMYGALTMQTQRPTYQDFAIGMQDAAQALVTSGDLTQTQYDAISAALADHGLLDCGRDITLEADEEQTNVMFNFVMVAYMMGQMGGGTVTCEEARTAQMPMINRPFPAIPNNFQFKKTVPAGATSLTLRVRHTPGTDLQYWIYARRGELVHFNEEDFFGMITLVDVDEFDHEFGPFDADDQTVTIDLDSDPALEAGQDYYFAITQKHCTTAMGQPARMNVYVSAETDDTPVTPDAGVQSDASTDATPDAGTGDGGNNKGCSCTQRGPGHSAPLGTLVFGLLALVWIRRRR